jgi:hypothetical protein
MAEMAKQDDFLFPFVCMQVRTAKWPGKTKLKAEDLDLEEDEIAENVVLGSRKLYPDEWMQKFNKVHGKAIRFLNNKSLPFIVDTVRAVPRMRIQKIVNGLVSFRAEYNLLVNEFLSEIDEIREKMLADFPKTFKAEDIPSRDKLRKKFGMSWIVFEVKGPNTSALDEEEVIDAFTQAKKEVDEKMAQFVEESVKLLRIRVAKVVTNLQEKLTSGKVIKNSTLDSIKGIYEWFKELNVFQDKSIDSALEKLKSALPEDAAYFKGNKELKDKITSLADEVVKKAEELEDLDTIKGKYARVVEIEEAA